MHMGCKMKIPFKHEHFLRRLWEKRKCAFSKPNVKMASYWLCETPPSIRIDTIVTYVLGQVSILETSVGVSLVQCKEL